jgi:hypothetical protein
MLLSQISYFWGALKRILMALTHIAAKQTKSVKKVGENQRNLY